MHRFVVSSLVFFAIVISCMGQSFQYSRGWTNGKRSSLSSQLHQDPAIAEVFEVTESDRRLEKCIIQLQRLIHNLYLIRPSHAASGNGNLFSNGNGGSISSSSNRHQSNEIFEDMAASEPGEFSTKNIN